MLTKRNVSPLRGVVAPVEWLQVPHSTPSSLTPGRSWTESPSRHSLAVLAS